MFNIPVLILSEDVQHIIDIFLIVFFCISLAYSLSISIGMSGAFESAKKSKMGAYIPIYNVFAVLDLIKLPTFFGLLIFIPILNIIIIYYINLKLCEFYKKSYLYFIGMLFLPVVFMFGLQSSAGAKKSIKEKEIEEKPIEYSMKNEDVNLLTDKELAALNETKDEEEKVDSIFKADVDLIEKAKPYKAGKQKVKIMQEDSPYEKETIKKVEAVKATTLKRQSKFVKDEDVIEKID